MNKSAIMERHWPKPSKCDVSNISLMQDSIAKMMDEYLISVANIKQLSKLSGISYPTLHKRIKVLGWDTYTAITTPQSVPHTYKKIIKKNGSISL